MSRGKHPAAMGAACVLIVTALLVAGSAYSSELKTQRDVPGWPGRAYDLFLPSSYGALVEVPLIVAIHGGGGNKRAQRKLSCPGGDLKDPGCMQAIANREGFAVAFPNGSGPPIFRNIRTWNAGGGKNGFQCVSGRACVNGVDDVAYFEAMLEDIGSTFQIDISAVYVTGMSNGAAMAHRLACELGDRIAGIAAVGGANQHATVAPCIASTAVMQIHGDADPCWALEGGEISCVDGNAGTKAGVTDTVEDWARRNHCMGAPVAEQLADTSADGTSTIVYRYQGCSQPVTFYVIQNGGHTWPSGYQYFRERRIGRMSLDFDASKMIVEFFKAQSTNQR